MRVKFDQHVTPPHHQHVTPLPTNRSHPFSQHVQPPQPNMAHTLPTDMCIYIRGACVSGLTRTCVYTCMWCAVYVHTRISVLVKVSMPVWRVCRCALICARAFKCWHPWRVRVGPTRASRHAHMVYIRGACV